MERGAGGAILLRPGGWNRWGHVVFCQGGTDGVMSFFVSIRELKIPEG